MILHPCLPGNEIAGFHFLSIYIDILQNDPLGIENISNYSHR